MIRQRQFTSDIARPRHRVERAVGKRDHRGTPVVPFRGEKGTIVFGPEGLYTPARVHGQWTKRLGNCRDVVRNPRIHRAAEVLSGERRIRSVSRSHAG